MVLVHTLSLSYPPLFIEKELRKFHHEHLSTSPFLPFIDSEKEFFLVRDKLSSQPTTRQSQVARSAAAADIPNNPSKETTKTIPQHANEKEKKLIIHYRHEKRFTSFKQDMHQLYDDVFNNTPVSDVKMIVGSRNRRDARNELIRKRPQPSLLKNISKKSKK